MSEPLHLNKTELVVLGIAIWLAAELLALHRINKPLLFPDQSIKTRHAVAASLGLSFLVLLSRMISKSKPPNVGLVRFLSESVLGEDVAWY